MLKKEQGGDSVARPVHRDRQVRRAQPETPGAVGGEEIDAIRRRFLRVQRGHENHPRAERMQRIDRPQNVCQRLGRTAGKLIELEMIGRDDVGRRDGARFHEGGDVLMHEHAAADIADHRIAAIARLPGWRA